MKAVTALCILSACLGDCARALIKPGAAQAPTQTISIYLSPSGDDGNPGTLNRPLRTIQAAQRAVRAAKAGVAGEIDVYLRGGTYNLASPVTFTSADSGSDGQMIRYVAYQNEVPILSGGVDVSGWKKYKGDIYKAHLQRDGKLRQLYVNNQRAFMARGKDFAYSPAIQGYGTFVISGHEPWAINSGIRFAGYTFSKSDLARYKHPEDVELCSKAGFGYHTISLSGIRTKRSEAIALLQQPIGAIAESVPQDGGAFVSNKPELKAISEFHFQNALELLQSPGQFYFDRSHHVLYYFKRPNEDMQTAHVVAPISEGLLALAGSSTAERVKNIEFRGITFAFSHYSLTKVADSYGDTTIQSIALFTKYVNEGESTPLRYANTTTQRAAIGVTSSDHIDFVDDVFEHIGGVGVSLGNDASHSHVIGNVFRDIGSAGLNVGDPKNVYIGDGDFPPGVEGIPTDDVIENNYLTDLGMETLQAPGVTLFYTQHLDFSHNEIQNTPYTGLSLGWGWTAFTRLSKPKDYSTSARDNKIDFNRISDVLQKMHDGGGIYVLGEQPGSEIVGNYFGKVGGFSEGASIYLDQGSRYLRIRDNYSDNPGGWFFVWGKAAQVYDIDASQNYSSVLQGLEGANLNGSPKFLNARSTPETLDLQHKAEAGLQSSYTGLRTKVE